MAIPWVVLDSAAYQALSHPAKALLVEVARQLRGDNNGALLCTREYMGKRGWSWDVVHRAKGHLIAAGFLHETVKGARPNKASWYAVTWCDLDQVKGLDPGAAATFVRGAYKPQPQAKAKPTRDELYAKWNSPQVSPALATGVATQAAPGKTHPLVREPDQRPLS